MLQHETIKQLFLSAVQDVTSHIQDFAIHSDKDFSRTRKIPPEKLILFLVAQGSSSTRVEMLDFFGFDPNIPTSSAFVQQRAKLKLEGLKAVFDAFNLSLFTLDPVVPRTMPGYRCLAADGSNISFYSAPQFSSDDYFTPPAHSMKGFYSLHLNTFYDIDRHMYTDALLQPAHSKNEFGAFCTMVDRISVLTDLKDIYIGDRGYCSYNNIAHVMEKGQFFLFRSKDVLSKGILQNLGLPTQGTFDRSVTITLCRRNSRKILCPEGSISRFIGKDVSFDYVEYGSDNTYTLSFRCVRVKLSSGSYECLITNLPEDEFPPESLKDLYFTRWKIECAYRDLKYTVGVLNFHSAKASFVEQEVLARLLAYNVTEALIQSTIVETGDTKHEYKVSFSRAVHICRVFLRLTTEEDPINTVALLRKELIPIRKGRNQPRLKTAHFRKPKYLLYRAA